GELRADTVNGEAESPVHRKRETMLGFGLHLIERIAGRKTICIQVSVAGRLKIEFAAPLCSFERAPQQMPALPNMSCPGNNQASKVEINSCLEALQSLFFNQVIAELRESESGAVITKAWASNEAQHRIGQA